MSGPSRKDWTVGVLCHDRSVFILSHAPRSKWNYLTCFCKRERKNGSCKRSDAAIAVLIRPEAHCRVLVEHPKDAV